MSITPLPPADFTPTTTGYTKQGAFRFWCQTVLPIVYDDSLSYYELLNKVVSYLNNTILDVASLENNFSNLYDSYNNLQDYVNNYFTGLDVQEEINNKLDEMAQNGLFSSWLRYVTPEMFGAVGDGETDDTQSFQNAIDSGMPVYAFSRSYLITSTINISTKTLLKCYGTINYIGNDYAFFIHDHLYSDLYFSEIQASNGGGLYLKSSNALTSEITIHTGYINVKTNCIYLQSTNTYGLQYIDFYVTMLRSIQNCIKIESSAGNWVGEIKLFGGILTNNEENGYGLYVSGNALTAFRVFGTGFENLGKAFRLQNASECSFYGCRFEDVDNTDGIAYEFIDRVNSFLCEADIYYINQMDFSLLTTTYNSPIVFRGVIRNTGGYTIGEEYVVIKTNVQSDIVKFPRTNYNKNSAYVKTNSTYENEFIGFNELYPDTIWMTKSMKINSTYSFEGKKLLYVFTEGVGLTLTDENDNVIFTTEKQFEIHAIHSLLPRGTNFLTWIKNGYYDQIIKQSQN